jgi:hypothetical protein
MSVLLAFKYSEDTLHSSDTAYALARSYVYSTL